MLTSKMAIKMVVQTTMHNEITYVVLSVFALLLILHPSYCY